MKVLKFGGTSVGSVDSLLSVKRIVEQSAKKTATIVVVSALGGITDKLISTAALAKNGSDDWRVEFDKIADRHRAIIDTVITETFERERLFQVVDALLDQLRSLYFGVYLISDLSDKILDTILSYGERLSSQIVSSLIKGAKYFDARDFIKTENKAGKNILDTQTTEKLVKESFKDLPRVSVVPGFISRDKVNGKTTNLGRGGSDYTAAILAASLDAEILEIWTDVDGFMTADPRIIQTAYTIDELSYSEAMELCNFGAKVVYPPTIYPVYVKDIPICIKNTFKPQSKGTVISNKVYGNNNKLIRGISSIDDTALITVAGLSMVGVIGINRRIFTTLADNGISVFLVSQASSENSTSIGVRSKDAEEAVRVLNEEFAKEITTGAMFPMEAECGLATVAIVGENMKHTPGIAGKLFGTLGRSGISVIACAQGASETNISFVVNEKSLRKALNVLHDSFFLSEYKELNLFICGIGTVGSKLIEQIKAQYIHLKETSRLKLEVVGIASSKKMLLNRNGINLDNYKDELAKNGEVCTPELLLNAIHNMNIFNSVFVDCTASKEVSDLYLPLLAHNISVVTANKIAASSSYDSYKELKATALSRGVKFRYETNVGAGLPIIGTINDLMNSGDHILKIEAVLSGTLNFIFNKISKDTTFSEAVRLAKEEGYSEPDPRIDLSGKDVIRKLVILTREAGYEVEQEDVEKHLFVPDALFKDSVEEFWKALPGLDDGFEKRRSILEKDGKRWRFVARMQDGKTSVSLEEIKFGHPFYNLEGSNNIVLLTTERYKEYPMQIQGYGAGASVTAAGVFANIIGIANI